MKLPTPMRSPELDALVEKHDAITRQHWQDRDCPEILRPLSAEARDVVALLVNSRFEKALSGGRKMKQRPVRLRDVRFR